MIAASYSLLVEGASFEPGHMSQLAFITNLGKTYLTIFSVLLSEKFEVCKLTRFVSLQMSLSCRLSTR